MYREAIKGELAFFKDTLYLDFFKAPTCKNLFSPGNHVHLVFLICTSDSFKNGFRLPGFIRSKIKKTIMSAGRVGHSTSLFWLKH